jgi:putative resolvase
MPRVPSYDQKDDLKRQAARLETFAKAQGWTDYEVAAEIGSGLNGRRRKLLRILRDPQAGRIVAGRRDRSARFGFELLEAALCASGKRIVVVEEGEVVDDLARDVLEILTSACGGFTDAVRRVAGPGGLWRRWDANEPSLSLRA